MFEQAQQEFEGAAVEAPAEQTALSWLKRLLAPLVLVGVMLAVFYAHSPAITSVPSRDASVYVYSGQQLLRGALPYRDFWDHRPPGLFYLNAVGLILGGGSIWGVWALEALCLCGAVVLSYVLLRRTFGGTAAFLGTFAWVITVPLMYDIDLAEEFALLFQFAALFFFVRAEARGRYGADAAGIGVTLALSMNLRPNLVGVWMGIVLLLLVRAVLTRNLMPAVRAFAGIAIGWLAVMLPIVLYFAAIGQLGEMWNAAYVFNFLYANTSWSYRFDTFQMGIGILAQTGIIFTAIAGWLIGLVLLIRRRSIVGAANELIALSLVLLPVELFLSSLSGRLYPHYFISPLPVTGVLTALLLSTALPKPKSARLLEFRWLPTALIGVLLVLLASINPLKEVTAPPNPTHTDRGLPSLTAEFIAQHTRPTDYVLVWGAAASVYTGSNRVASSRYVNNYTLFMPGFSTPELIQSYIDELKAHPPAYIIDTSRTDGRFSPMDPQGRQEWARQKAANTRHLAELEDFAPVPAMSLLFGYFDQNYRYVGRAGLWWVYQRNGFQPPSSASRP